MSYLALLLLSFTVLAYALVGGVFLAFSDFIMRSLARASDVAGAEVMQIINREVFHWVFMTLFLGMSGVSVAVLGYALFALDGASGALIAAAGAVYLVGCFGVTVRFNVPLNNALEKFDLNDSAVLPFWLDTYVPSWSRWNTVRTLSCVVASALLLAGLVQTS